MNITIGNDHAAPQLKFALVEWLESNNYTVKNVGCDTDESVDYPDFAHKVALDVENNVCDFGVLICGSGEGVAMTANKHQNIRAALCWNTEIAELSRLHNNANILCLPGRFLTIEEGLEILKVFLAGEFEGGRHQKRIDKIPL